MDKFNDIRQNVYKSLGRDGADEIMGGFSLVLIAFFFSDQRLGFLFILGVGLYMPLKILFRKKFTYPRIGFARLPTPFVWKSTFLRCLIALILGLILMAFLKIEELGWVLPLYTAVLLISAEIISAGKTGSVLNYVVATFFLAAAIFGLILIMTGMNAGKAAAIQLWISASILMPIGLLKFIKFLVKHPCVQEKVSDGTIS